jgi:hypothetical protein
LFADSVFSISLSRTDTMAFVGMDAAASFFGSDGGDLTTVGGGGRGFKTVLSRGMYFP